MARIILIVALVLVALLLAASWALAGFTMTGTRQTLEEARAWQQERYDTSFYDSVERSAYVVEGEGDYIILSHGYTDNRMGSLKYARLYLDLGFNCIVYDLRGHGENEPTFTSYGILEGRDLALLVADTRERYPEASQLGLQGESLGAASTISSLAYDPDVDFVVADCGFESIERVLRDGYRSAGVPGFLFDLGNLGSRLRYGYALSDARPIDALDDNTVPILFVHGADDPFIVPENSEDMAARTKGMAEVVLIDGAAHAESALVAPELYEQYLAEFLASLA